MSGTVAVLADDAAMCKFLKMKSAVVCGWWMLMGRDQWQMLAEFP